jgi:DNA-directed RNA polymerase specialized sigma24 family protein
MRRSEFQDFYEANRDACLRSVLAVVGDRQLAEDVVAEAFTEAYASWHTVRRHPVPRAWIVRTALNMRVSWWRRRRREVPLDGGGYGGGYGGEVAATGQSDPAVDPALLAVLRLLPQRQREVIALRIFLDLDTKTTARVLGLAPGTVKAHLSRAVSTLRDQLVITESLEA